MWAVSRFRVTDEPPEAFAARAGMAADFMRTRTGCRSAEVVRNLDDPELWALVSHWDNVGSYRRAFNGYDGKVILTVLLSEAIDEPGAYATPDDVGENLPRSAVT